MNRADDVIESQAALRREGKHVARVRGLRTLQARLPHSSPKRPASARACSVLPSCPHPAVQPGTAARGGQRAHRLLPPAPRPGRAVLPLLQEPAARGQHHRALSGAGPPRLAQAPWRRLAARWRRGLGADSAPDAQLRNLVWATSTHDVYLVHGAGVKHWNDAARRATKARTRTRCGLRMLCCACGV
jgi:hypothetical protein